VSTIHPSALEFLRRDCFNITAFFRNRGIPFFLRTRELYDLIRDDGLKEEQFSSYLDKLKTTLSPDRVLTREEVMEEEVWLKLDLPRDLNDILDPTCVENGNDGILRSTLHSIHRLEEGDEESDSGDEEFDIEGL